MATRAVERSQVRGFALIWTAITIVISVATFFGIYLTYDNSGASLGQNNVSIPISVTDAPPQVAVVNTSTPPPTPTPSPTPDPTAVAMAIIAAQDAPTPTIAPTSLPVNDTAYDVGIQVQYSLDLNPDTQRIWMNDVERLGLRWMKQQVRWAEVEPQRGQYDWSKLDLALPVAAEYGIRVLISVVAAPDWAREPGVDLTREGPPANIQDFTGFIRAVLERFPGMIHAIEVWNEQNLGREWTSSGGLSAANYVTMLRETYLTVRNIDPGIIIVSGALSPTGVSDGVTAIDDFDYLDQLIEAGLLNYTDCVGAHHNGYNIGPNVTWDNVPNDPTAVFRGPFDNPHHSWSFRSTLQTYANKIALAGGDQRLCVTEFGWASVEDMDGYPQNFEFALDNTLAEQAEWIVEALQVMDEWDIVWLAFIWNLNYGPQAGWSTESDNPPYSLIGPGFAHRPAFDAIREWSTNR